MNRALRASDFPPAAASPLSALVELRRVRPCSRGGSGLRAGVAGVTFYADHSGVLRISSEAVSPSHHSCAHWRSTSAHLGWRGQEAQLSATSLLTRAPAPLKSLLI